MDRRIGFPVMAILTGTLITVMIQFNTLLGGAVGLFFSILVIQLSGLVLAELVILILRPERGEPVSPWLRMRGLIGVAMVLSNTLCFQQLGASLTLSAVILGQSTTSLAYDLTGFLGLTRYRFNREKIIGFALSLAGILLMAGRMTEHWTFILLALFTGTLTITQMVINARLAGRIGLMRATRNNFIWATGLCILLCLALGIPLTDGFRSLKDVPLHYSLGGGWLGVIAVALSSWIVPKIPTVYSSLLLFSGQITMALILDAFRFGSVSIGQLGGVLLILAGMLWNIRVDVKKAANGSGSGEEFQQQSPQE